ncbi:MAG: S1 RNA-binding domain-containing protein, partial [Acidobacteriota bacterium]
DLDDSGLVKIFSVDKAAGGDARKRVELITADVEVGTVYEGKVAKLMDFGAFVTILPGKDGLVHISQLAPHRVRSVADEISEGEQVLVKVLEIDRQGKIRLSRKDAMAQTGAEAEANPG